MSYLVYQTGTHGAESFHADIFAPKVFWWLVSVEYIRSRSEDVAVTVAPAVIECERA